MIPGLSEQSNRNYYSNYKLASYNLVTDCYIFTKLKHETTGFIVYKISYVSCNNNNKSYVGMFSQYLKSRLYHHKHECKEIIPHKVEKTALTEHPFFTGFEFDFDRVDVLDFMHNYQKINKRVALWKKFRQ